MAINWTKTKVEGERGCRRKAGKLEIRPVGAGGRYELVVWEDRGDLTVEKGTLALCMAAAEEMAVEATPAPATSSAPTLEEARAANPNLQVPADAPPPPATFEEAVVASAPAAESRTRAADALRKLDGSPWTRSPEGEYFHSNGRLAILRRPGRKFALMLDDKQQCRGSLAECEKQGDTLAVKLLGQVVGAPADAPKAPAKVVETLHAGGGIMVDVVDELVWKGGNNPRTEHFKAVAKALGIDAARVTEAMIEKAERHARERLKAGFKRDNADPKALIKTVWDGDPEFELPPAAPKTEPKAAKKSKATKAAKPAATTEEKGRDKFGSRLGSGAAKINAEINGEPLTAREITDLSAQDAGRVRSHLQALLKKGWIAVVEVDGVQKYRAR